MGQPTVDAPLTCPPAGSLSHPWYVLVGCVMLYLVGYLIQRSSNSQKNEFRKNPVNPALARE